MRIHQVLVGASPGDAITESALLVRDALRSGVESDVYALHRDARLAGQVERLEDFPASAGADDVILFHVSIGDQRVADFVLHRPERLVLEYHNITPASFFQELAPTFAAMLRSGRSQLRMLLGRAVGVIADSEFNAAELREHTDRPIVVAPPALNVRRLVESTPDPGVVEAIAQISEPIVLCVGQLLPHKRPELAVQAHHYLNINHLPGARLVLAGPPRNQRYTDALVAHVQSINLPTVWLTGEITDAQLAAFFQGADALLVPSEHEGFCVPIVEAMAFGLPVVARDFGAIRSTTGDAGLVLPCDAGAAMLAEATARVITDTRLRDELARRGRERATRFSTDRTRREQVDALLTVLSGRPAAV